MTEAESVEPLIIAANSGDEDAASRLETMYSVSETLAVYGSLAPGRSNYHIVEPLGGEWTDGYIEGDLFQTGWGAALGYWAFRPRAGGEKVEVKVLKSSRLSDAWKMLDEFEGDEYRRILVVVMNENGEFHTVANLYASADER